MDRVPARPGGRPARCTLPRNHEDRVSSLGETLASLHADRDARRFDGAEFEDAVLRHAAGIPSWEIAECWRYLEWPVPLPSHDTGIDLVAVKHDGSRVAIQCKARSGGGTVTTTQVQKVRRRCAVVGVRRALDGGGSRQERSDGGCRRRGGGDVR